MQASLDMGEGRYRDSFRRGMGVIGYSRFPNMLEMYAGLPRPHPSTVPLLLPQPKSRYKDTTQIMSLSLVLTFLGGGFSTSPDMQGMGVALGEAGPRLLGAFRARFLYFAVRPLSFIVLDSYRP